MNLWGVQFGTQERLLIYSDIIINYLGDGLYISRYDILLMCIMKCNIRINQDYVKQMARKEVNKGSSLLSFKNHKYVWFVYVYVFIYIYVICKERKKKQATYILVKQRAPHFNNMVKIRNDLWWKIWKKWRFEWERGGTEGSRNWNKVVKEKKGGKESRYNKRDKKRKLVFLPFSCLSFVLCI